MKFSNLAMCVMPGLMLGLGPTAAQANAKLEFTEESSLTLTATLDGAAVGTVNNVGPNHWEWRSGVLGQVMVLSPANLLWEEPGGETGVNSVQPRFFDLPVGGSRGDIGFDITSDVLGFNDFPKNANGAFGFVVTGFDFPPEGGQGVTVFGPADVYFLDLGDQTNTVPESSSTLVLLGLTVVGTCWAGRFRRGRAA